jgi:hypothetical protein
MRRKTLSARTFTRIGCRRMGCFNSTAYRESRRQTKSFACWVAFWIGVSQLVMSGGNSLPLSALFMFPSNVEMLQNKE